MDDTGIYLEKLVLFSQILRQKGFQAGTSETADAASLLTAFGAQDRETVKTALRTVYAHTREEQFLFDRAFDGFFLSAEAIRRQAEKQAQREKEREAQRTRAEEELPDLVRRAGLSEQQSRSYAEMPEEARKRLRAFMDRYRDTADRNPGLYSEFIHSVFTKTILEQQLLMENAGENCFAADPELGLLYRDISEFRDSDIPGAVAAVRQAASRINGELAAGKARSRCTGELDFRRTIRRGLESGGTFRRLAYRKHHTRRKRLVFLCDVSGSMMRFSEFALRFVQSLNRVSDHMDAFLFSERLVYADRFRLQNMDAFRDFIRESGVYGRGTDLGTALSELCSRNPPILTSGTVLIILSDTKTIDQGRALGSLKQACRQTGRVLWMNPIPEGKWQYLRSVQMVRELVPMVSCSNLHELSAACRRLALN